MFSFYDKIYIKKSYNKKFVLIKGYSPLGILVLLMNGFALFLPLQIFTSLFYSLSWYSIETVILILITFSLSLFGFGYKIRITPNCFTLHETFFFIPFLRVKTDITNVKFHNNPTDKETVVIQQQCDPWSEMGFSDWVGISYRGKEYDIGGNNNYNQILKTLQNSIQAMKKYR